MRDHDWSESSLGPPETWPLSLRTVVRLLLTSKFPMFVAWGADLVLLYNDSYAEILGGKHPRALGRSFPEVWAEIWPDVGPLAEVAMTGRAIFREDLPLLMNRRGFEEQTWFTFSYSPVHDDAGAVAGIFCACAEMTRKVEAEAAQARSIESLRRAQDHKQLLVDELNHRVKNTLATVQAIARHSFRDSDDQAARTMFESRLMALSKAHDVLTRQNWEGADLHAVVDEAISPHCGARAHACDVEGAVIRLNARLSLPVAMTLHELSTNAAKYGALSTDAGRLTIRWIVTPSRPRRLIFHWQESGGPPVRPPSRKGFGSRLIEHQLARELGGIVRLDFNPEGVLCVMEIPLEENSSSTPLPELA